MKQIGNQTKPVRKLSCPSCGAPVQHTGICSYCGGLVIVRPDYLGPVIPPCDRVMWWGGPEVIAIHDHLSTSSQCAFIVE